MPTEPSIRHRIGGLLDQLGEMMLPVGLGAVGGFWAADQGMRLIPTLLELVLGWSVVALLFIALGAGLRGKLYVDSAGGRVWRGTAVVALLGAAIAAGLRLSVWWTDQADLARLTPAEFEAAFTIDRGRYTDDRAGLSRMIARLEVQGIPPRAATEELSDDDEKNLLEAWVAMRSYAIDLDQLRRYWEGYYAYDPSRAERSYHLRAYLLTYAAELTLYTEASRFSQRVMANDNAKTFLDSPHPEVGLPSGSFSRFREDLLGATDEARVIAGERYLQLLSIGAGARDEARALGVEPLWFDVERSLVEVKRAGWLDRAETTVRADSQLLKRGVVRMWFPAQAGVAEWMGDTRVRRVGRYLIPQSQADELEKLLEPGDTMVARKNWYLSNVGLPGFWPHAMLYIGGPEKLRAWADDPEVRAWASAELRRDGSLADLLAVRFPLAWAEFQEGHGGEELPVIEAISEGISLSAMHHVTGDYVAALRPRLTKAEKARAIVVAFSHLGKPYDMDFDFATDHALVCTELVWRSYHAPDAQRGVDWPLIRVAGRQTLPANVMIQQWAESLTNGGQQLDFVAFIDAKDKTEETFFSTAEVLAASWQRPQWDVLQP